VLTPEAPHLQRADEHEQSGQCSRGQHEREKERQFGHLRVGEALREDHLERKPKPRQEHA